MRLRDLAVSLAVMIARDRAVPAQPLLAGRNRHRARATSPGSCSGARTTTGSSTRDSARGDRPAGAARRRGRALAAASGGVLARDAAPVLDRGPGRLLLAVAGEGIPVPAADRPGARGAGRPRALPAADAGRARSQVARQSRSSLSACSFRRGSGSRPRADTFLAGSGGLPGGRETGEWIDAQRAGGIDLHDHRPVDGEHRPVLRPSQGLRAVGQPQPAEPQPLVRAADQPGSRASATASSSTSSGTRSPPPAPPFFSGSCWATSTATTAGSSTPRCSRPRRRWARARTGRSSSSTRCGREPSRTRSPSIAGPRGRGARAPPSSRPTTPIEHFVVLMQENHSFDNYFGTYPGADGIPKGTCMPVGTRSRPCVRPFRLGDRPVPDLAHDRRIHRIQYARGRMDGFVRGGLGRPPDAGPLGDGLLRRPRPALLLERGRRVRPLRSLLRRHAGGSVANHMFWVTGTPGDPDGGFGDRPTIFDRLDRRGISWKFYVEDYDPRQPTQAVRVPLLNSARFVETRSSSATSSTSTSTTRTCATDAAPVAYIAPAGSSEHPPGRHRGRGGARQEAGHRPVAEQRLGSSAFMWTYDDWGGWFDHVRPPRIAGGTLGFRVPALLVSPYARRGHVDSTALDTTSILRFIEDNWGLAPLARARRSSQQLRRRVRLLEGAPRAPSIVAAERGSEDPAPVRRWVIYLGYGAALVLSALLIGWGVLRPRRRRCWRSPSCSALQQRPAAAQAHEARRSRRRSRRSRRCPACASRSTATASRPTVPAGRRRRRRSGVPAHRCAPSTRRSRRASARGSIAGTPAAGSPRSTSTTASGSASSTSTRTPSTPSAVTR